jgi:thymidylate synthase
MTYIEEKGYLNLLSDLIQSPIKSGRNGITLSLFAINYKFSLTDGFPLLTTKKMYYKGIIAELLWFLKGETNSKILEEQNVNIWKGNSSQEFINFLNLPYTEGECGPIYGWQWRNFNASYPDKKEKGFDQLRYIIDEIKKGSRRAVLSAWNPQQLNEMVLPPCHILYTFYKDDDNNLSCHLFMRSNDTFLGFPFNLASLSLLTHIIAICTNTKPKEVSISVTDAHLYTEHIDQVKIQISREPFKKPFLHIKNVPQKQLNTDEAIQWIENLQLSDFQFTEYNSHDKITANMVV